MFFQELILTLQRYWHEQGCLLVQPYDMEKGAATFSPATFLRSLGPEPFNAAYPEPCRRPTDGRYGDNPMRMQHYYQFQVVMKPSPANILDLYFGSLRAIGITPEDHDLRLVHDDWESPTLGAWGLGWEVWADGMEVTQFTYFQQVGGMELKPVPVEITYGLERLCMFIQKVDNVFEVAYNESLPYGELFHQNEVQYSRHNFELADVALHTELFRRYEQECGRLCEAECPAPAADYCLKASHSFNLLDARGAISVSERQNYILRVRKLARQVAEAWMANREALGFPICARSQEGRVAACEPGAAEAPEVAGERAPLLVELGVEEMPARVFGPLRKDLPQLFEKFFDAAGLEPEDVRFLLTPRRIAVSVASMRTRQPDRVVEQKGPPVRIARDGEGNWTKAAAGFAARNGMAPEQLSVRKIKGVDYLFAVVEEPGRAATAVLAEVIPQFLGAIHWYKTMRWGDGDCAFVRPVQWLVALLGDAVVPCSFGGVTAGRMSRGHRFMTPEPLAVPAEREGYLAALRAVHVLADQDERRETIREGVQALAEAHGQAWREDVSLLDEVTFLTEDPVPVYCTFAEEYLEIPESVLVSEMKEHQRYLALNDASGRLANGFVAVSNMRCNDMAAVRAGYEHVLKSRFADGAFFLQEDMKTPLRDRVARLEKVVFQAQLGTYREKVERIRALASRIATGAGLDADAAMAVDTIALLCKADLTSAMVGEFPELQGEIGAYYGHREGLAPVVADGIRDHYLPRGANDLFPNTIEGAVVGIADRIDSLAGIFAIGRAPTGSADPFGLRRACLTSIALIVKFGLPVDLEELLARAIALHAEKLEGLDGEALQEQILEFTLARAKGLFQDDSREGIPGGFAYDTIEAVVQASAPWTCLTDLVRRLEAMSAFRERDDFGEVAATFKRVNNILRGIEVEDGPIDPARFVHDEERALAAALSACDDAVTACLGEQRYLDALAAVVPLRGTVDAFFDAVLVNDPDEAVRANRQRLVQAVVTLVKQVADFSAIQ